jgi:phosphoribosylformimino-5-aminoimidazole carboxamide ribotide isomerase
MRVIPVIDLMNGVVVRGVGGRRDEYRPIQSRIAPDAQPATVARAFADQFSFGTVYVADLDAIMRGRPNVEAWKQIAAAGFTLWLDAGAGNAEVAEQISREITRAELDVRLVVGLESLESEVDLRAICQLPGIQLPVFSLDLRDGAPLVRNPAWSELRPLEIALLVRSLGIHDTIVLDLADVGMEGGTRTRDLCRLIRREMPTQRLIAGGGVRGANDLRALAEAGCDNALVASALHDGRLTREDIWQTGMSAPRQSPTPMSPS